MSLHARAVHSLTPADRAEVVALHDAARRYDGHPSLGDAVWREVDDPASPGGPARAAHVLVTDDDRLVGYGNLAPADNADPPHVAAGLVVLPDARGGDVEALLLDVMIRDVAEHGGALVIWWRFGAGDDSDELASRAGFRPARSLNQMLVPLPIGEEPRWPEGVEVRSFEPGRDEDAWLVVNNRAFAGHPEQGGWTRSTLTRRMREPWFDPTGFLLAFDRDGLAGFCWTKVHPETALKSEAELRPAEPTGAGARATRRYKSEAELRPAEPTGAGARATQRYGEIYVIGVDPSRQGRKLGRPLVVAGLRSLAQRGVATGMLFVDAANEAATRLYTSLGFETTRVDRAYERKVEPA